MADNFETPKITTTVTLPRDPRLLVRDHNTILRETLREAAFEHHRRHIPWHFESFAPAKYGYARRGKKYQAKRTARDCRRWSLPIPGNRAGCLRSWPSKLISR